MIHESCLVSGQASSHDGDGNDYLLDEPRGSDESGSRVALDPRRRIERTTARAVHQALPRDNTTVTDNQENIVASTLSGATSSTNELEHNMASSRRPPAYNIDAHINSSVDSDQANMDDVFGEMTPQAPRYGVADLMDRAREDLGRAWEEGLDILVQMIAQEIAHIASRHEGDQGQVLRCIASTVAPYRNTQFELGVALPPRWQQWMQALIADSSRVELHRENANDHSDGDRSDDFSDAGDATSLMGFSSTRGRARQGEGGPEGDRRTRTTRPRSRSARRRPNHTEEEESERYATTPPWRRPEPMSSSARVAPRPTTRDVLRTNRHTWRCLLGMQDEGPGTNESVMHDRPVAPDNAANIEATVEDMTSRQRLIFFGTFLRFLLELSQQVHEIMITGYSGPADVDVGGDGSSFMQGRLAVQQKARILLSSVQSSLDQLPQRKSLRARKLHELLKNYFLNVPEHRIPEEVTEFQAVLTVYENEFEDTMASCTEEVDAIWTQTWWKRVLAVVQQLQEGMYHTEATSSTSARVEPNTTTEPEEVLQTQHDSEGEHNLRLHEEAEREEAEHMIALFDEYQREQQAKQFREQEQREFQEAMQQPPPKARRLQIDVEVKAGDATTRARLHAPLLPAGQSATIALTFKQIVEPDINASHTIPAAEGDETHLMQQRPIPQEPSTEHPAQEGLRRLRELLRGIHPGIRGGVLAKLRQLIMQELRRTLSQGMNLIEVLNSEQLGNSTDTSADCDVTIASMAQFLLEHLHLPDLMAETEVTNSELSNLLQGLQNSLLEPEGDSAASGASSSTTLPVGPPVLGTGEDIRSMVEDLRTALNSMLMRVEPEDHLEARRCLVLELIDYVQVNAACTLTTLLLLVQYLPQPNQVVQSGSTQRFGRQAIECIDEAMRTRYRSTASASSFRAPFGQEDVVPLLPALHPLLLETIMFLKSGEWLSDDEDAESQNATLDTQGFEGRDDGDGGTGGDGSGGATSRLTPTAGDHRHEDLSAHETGETPPAAPTGLMSAADSLETIASTDAEPTNVSMLQEDQETKPATHRAKGSSKGGCKKNDKGNKGIDPQVDRDVDKKGKGPGRRRPSAGGQAGGLRRWLREI